jgi:hypothetical protein
VCKGHGVELENNCARGAELRVSPKYFQCGYQCIFEIAIKLSQVLWRKLRPDQIDSADDNIIDVTYNLLLGSKFNLACRLLDFACTILKKFSSEQCRLTMVANRAQAYKWAGDPERCKNILSAEDWSACGPQFHLAISVLNDRFEEAAGIMRAIGPKGVVKEEFYQEWPMFREFRKSDEFASAYQEVFGGPFIHVEKALKAVEKQKLLDALDKLRKDIDDDTIPADSVRLRARSEGP